MASTAAASHNTLVLIAEEAYVVGLAAALASVARHTRPLPHITVLDTGLAGSSKESLSKICPSIAWVDARPRAGNSAVLPETAGYPSASTWLKLHIPHLLPPGVERALYIDCDMITRTSLAPLWAVDLQGKLLAAVRDFGAPCGHPGLEALGWPMDRPYFNAGLLLLDIRRLRQLSGRAAGIIAAHGSSLRFHDQDVFNLLCMEGGWVELEHKWNAQGLGTYAAFRTRPEPGRPQLLSCAQLQAMEASPAIVHFTGPPNVAPLQFLNPYVPFTSKPWAYVCQHPHQAEFYELLDATPWAGWRPDWRTLVDAAASELRCFASTVQQQRPGFPAAEFLGAVAAQLC